MIGLDSSLSTHILRERMRIVMIGVIALVGAVLSLSFAATLPYAWLPVIPRSAQSDG